MSEKYRSIQWGHPADTLTIDLIGETLRANDGKLYKASRYDGNCGQCVFEEECAAYTPAPLLPCTSADLVRAGGPLGSVTRHLATSVTWSLVEED